MSDSGDYIKVRTVFLTSVLTEILRPFYRKGLGGKERTNFPLVKTKTNIQTNKKQKQKLKS